MNLSSLALDLTPEDPPNEEIGPDPLDPVVLGHLIFVFNSVLTTAFSFAGVITNSINMAVFYKMGLSDGVTQNLFILSVSDGLYALATAIGQSAYILYQLLIRDNRRYGDTAADVYVIVIFTNFIKYILLGVSTFITLVISIVRCCCVAMPLKVKYVLTAKRQLAAISIPSGIGIFIVVFGVAEIQLYKVHNPIINASITLYTGVQWPLIRGFNNITAFGSFVIIIACVIVLAASLSRASKFRESSTSAASSSKKDNQSSGFSHSLSDVKSKDRQRDARIVRTVLLISIVFIVCNTPLVVLTYFAIFIRVMSPLSKYSGENIFMMSVADAFSALNVVLNIFIYFYSNTRYRNTFTVLFGSAHKPSVSNTS